MTNVEAHAAHILSDGKHSNNNNHNNGHFDLFRSHVSRITMSPPADLLFSGI